MAWRSTCSGRTASRCRSTSSPTRRTGRRSLTPTGSGKPATTLPTKGRWTPSHRTAASTRCGRVPSTARRGCPWRTTRRWSWSTRASRTCPVHLLLSVLARRQPRLHRQQQRRGLDRER
ncbi:unnamed protein product [Phaeothamnion confervicola]